MVYAPQHILFWTSALSFLHPSRATAFKAPSVSVPTATDTKESSSALSFECSGSISSTFQKRFELVQVQIIHRHGDRTPITPMANPDFWKGTLPSSTLVSRIGDGTIVSRSGSDGSKVAHAAGGIGPFGKLTNLGILQMVDVGSRILDELHMNQDDGTNTVDDDGYLHINSGFLFTNTRPIHPSKVRIKSTDFPRTIQSVQALMLGLFPLGYDGEVEIDASHTDILIPDPQPRLSAEQVELERILSQRPHLLEKEKELETLADRVVEELLDVVDWENAHTANFGIGEEGDQGRKRSLSFSQLSEVLTCLHVRELMPESISHDDYRAITSHSAWKWFENLRDEKLAKLAMKGFMDFIMETLRDGLSIEKSEDDVLLHIYSCHDSSLIGLLCAFKLEPPAQWPEYGSFLKVELFKVEEAQNDVEDSSSGGTTIVKHYVRFSLNGEVLKSSWGKEGQDGSEEEEVDMESKGMICLERLSGSISRAHGHGHE